MSRSPSFETVLEGRVKFELNPVYPPEDCSDAVRFLWMQMTPKERRKNFVLHEIEQCRTIPMVRWLNYFAVVLLMLPFLLRSLSFSFLFL